MKEWFKYSYGFINIDDENVYFTKTGNWSDTVGLEEKNANAFKKADYSQKVKGVIYLTLTGGLFLTIMILNLLSGQISYLLLCGLLFGGYAAYNYMIPEVGATFVVPKKKVVRTHVEDNVIVILFLDANTKETFHRLPGLNDQAREFILNLKNADLETSGE